MRRVLGFVLVASLSAIPYAQAGQPRTHDGLFLRLSGGVGFENLNYHSFPDDVSNGNWDGVSFAIRFSATLN
jgi:hypothetical protein